ncbi:MAG: heparinase II/III family protein [Armatimonadota bacterium]
MKSESVTVTKPDIYNNLYDITHVVKSANRPFLIAEERELSVLRRGLTKDGWKKELYTSTKVDLDDIYVAKGLLTYANECLNKKIEIPEQCEFEHTFAYGCKCGPFISNNKNQIKKSPSSNLDIIEMADSEYQMNLHNAHIELARATLSLALVYSIERDKKFSDKAAEILIKYANAYPNKMQPGFAGMLGRHLCESVWIIPLAQAYDLIYYSRSLDEIQRAHIEKSLFALAAEWLSTSDCKGYQGMWHLSAIGCIGWSIKSPILVAHALEQLHKKLQSELGIDGFWKITPRLCHFYPLNALIQFTEASIRAGINIYDWEFAPGRTIKEAFLAPINFTYQSLKIASSDETHPLCHLPMQIYEVAHRRWNDSIFGWVLQKGYKTGKTGCSYSSSDSCCLEISRNSFYAMMFGRDIPGRLPTPTFKSCDYPELGASVIRNDVSVVTLDYGPSSDDHADKLSFTFFSKNKLLIPDTGSLGDRSLQNGYCRSTEAHNTIVVDQKTQKKNSEYNITRNFCSEHFQIMDLWDDTAYDGIKHQRSIALLNDVLVIKDTLESEQQHTYDWFMHCPGKAEIICDSKVGNDDFSQYKTQWITKPYQIINSCKINWICDDIKLTSQIWTSNYMSEFILGEAPYLEDKKLNVLAVRQFGSRAQFVSVFVAREDNNHAHINRRGRFIEIAHNDLKDYIVMEGENELGNAIETDASWAALRVCDSEILSISVILGTYLKYNDALIVQAPEMTKCIEVFFEGKNPSVHYNGIDDGIIQIKTSSKAMRLNGNRTSATQIKGLAHLKITPQMMNIQNEL